MCQTLSTGSNAASQAAGLGNLSPGIISKASTDQDQVSSLIVKTYNAEAQQALGNLPGYP